MNSFRLKTDGDENNSYEVACCDSSKHKDNTSVTYKTLWQFPCEKAYSNPAACLNKANLVAKPSRTQSREVSIQFRPILIHRSVSDRNCARNPKSRARKHKVTKNENPPPDSPSHHPTSDYPPRRRRTAHRQRRLVPTMFNNSSPKWVWMPQEQRMDWYRSTIQGLHAVQGGGGGGCDGGGGGGRIETLGMLEGDARGGTAGKDEGETRESECAKKRDPMLLLLLLLLPAAATLAALAGARIFTQRRPSQTMLHHVRQWGWVIGHAELVSPARLPWTIQSYWGSRYESMGCWILDNDLRRAAPWTLGNHHRSNNAHTISCCPDQWNNGWMDDWWMHMGWTEESSHLS